MDGSNPAKTFPGSEPNPAKTFARLPCAGRGSRPRRTDDAITEKLELGLTIQRIFQDLQEDYAYGYSYESVKRYVRTLAPRRRACGVMHSRPGRRRRWISSRARRRSTGRRASGGVPGCSG